MSDNSTEKKLSTKQVKALAEYFNSGDVAAATAAAKINRSTFYRWCNEDELFQAALKDAEARALAMIAGQLVALASKAGQVLIDILDDPEARPNQKLRAAEIVLNNLLRLRELYMLEERVSAIERGINEKS